VWKNRGIEGGKKNEGELMRGPPVVGCWGGGGGGGGVWVNKSTVGGGVGGVVGGRGGGGVVGGVGGHRLRFWGQGSVGGTQTKQERQNWRAKPRGKKKRHA